MSRRSVGTQIEQIGDSKSAGLVSEHKQIGVKTLNEYTQFWKTNCTYDEESKANTNFTEEKNQWHINI